MAKDTCLALLIFIVLANLKTTISIDHVHPSMRDPSSLNRSPSSVADSIRIIASSIDESTLANYVSSILYQYRTYKRKSSFL